MPYKDKERNLECMREWHATHKEHERQYNVNYRERKNECQQSRRIILKENGLCIVCRQPRSENSSLYCLLHLSRAIRVHRKMNNNPEYRERQKVYSKNKYYQFKSENKCASCGMPLNEESRRGVYCINCRTSLDRISY